MVLNSVPVALDASATTVDLDQIVRAVAILAREAPHQSSGTEKQVKEIY